MPSSFPLYLTAAMLAAPALTTPGSATAAPDSGLSWAPCRSVHQEWEKEDDRSECTTVTVPLDHAAPAGRTIGIAVSRIRATEPQRRRGVLLMNPGGPGNQGIGMPWSLTQTTLKDVGRDHDLIGFDPRGVGLSGGFECPKDGSDGVEPAPGAGAEQRFRAEYQTEAHANARCTGYDRELISRLNTRAVADDMDDIRVALGEKKISFFGISWGTALGAVYRSHYDRNVDRMLLDSVMPPKFSVETMERGTSAAKQAGYEDFAAWAAGRDSTYHLGRTSREVRDAALSLWRRLGEHPVTVKGPDGKTREYSDGSLSVILSYQRPHWDEVARSVAALRDGGVPPLTGEEPEHESWGLQPDSSGGLMMQRAVLCNDQGAAPDADAAWRLKRYRAEKYPMFANGAGYSNWCAGWPLTHGPGWDLQRGTSPLQLVGHRYETITPLVWAEQMKSRIGGEVLTVDNGAHGSLDLVDCASKGMDFLSTGRTSSGSCPGEPSKSLPGRPG